MNEIINHMHRCITLAKKGSGYVSPNPLVGAVLIKNGRIIGEGYHQRYGENHAEVNAINNTKEEVAGSTLCCNLEPCNHSTKQTPPCVPLIIDKKIKKVFISNIDPNPAVNGNGIKDLISAGISVQSGLLNDKGKELNKFYFKYVKEKIPFITIKIAQSLDGKISKSQTQQTWLTGKESQMYVHKLRSEYDAVLIGANTVKTDNPLLTVRLISGRNPVRIILDHALTLPLKSKIIDVSDPGKTWVVTSEDSSSDKIKKLNDKGIKVIKYHTKEGQRIKIKELLNILGKEKITSLLIEGGQDIFSQFVDQDSFDEIVILQSPKIIGKGLNVLELSNMKRLILKNVSRLGQDLKLTYVKNNLSLS